MPAGTSNGAPSRRARKASAVAARVRGSSGAAGTSTCLAALWQMTSTTSPSTERVMVGPSTEGDRAATEPGMASAMALRCSASMRAGFQATPKAERFWFLRPVRARRMVGTMAPRATSSTAQAATRASQWTLGPSSSGSTSAPMPSSQPSTSEVAASKARALSPLGSGTGARLAQTSSGAWVAARAAWRCSALVGGASGPPSQATKRPETQESCSTLMPGAGSPGSGSTPRRRSRAISSMRCSCSRSASTCWSSGRRCERSWSRASSVSFRRSMSSRCHGPLWASSTARSSVDASPQAAASTSDAKSGPSTSIVGTGAPESAPPVGSVLLVSSSGTWFLFVHCCVGTGLRCRVVEPSWCVRSPHRLFCATPGSSCPLLLDDRPRRAARLPGGAGDRHPERGSGLLCQSVRPTRTGAPLGGLQRRQPYRPGGALPQPPVLPASGRSQGAGSSGGLDGHLAGLQRGPHPLVGGRGRGRRGRPG